MKTIIHAPIPKRNMDINTYYFVKNKVTGEEKVAYLSNIYKVGIAGSANIVFTFDQDSDRITWATEEGFMECFTITGKVNKMVFS